MTVTCPKCGKRKLRIVTIIDVIGLVGYFAALVFGIVSHLSFHLSSIIALTCLITCYLASTFLCHRWKILDHSRSETM